MELFSIYTSLVDTFTFIYLEIKKELTNFNIVFDWRTLVFFLAVATSVWLVFFILQAVGLFVMAKNQKLRHKGLAFVPFANFILMEKLAGPSTMFGQRMRHPGVWVLLSQVVNFLLCTAQLAAQLYLFCVHGAPQYVESELGLATLEWIGLTDNVSLTVNAIYKVLFLGIPITQLVGNVLLFILIFGLYKKYQPKMSFLFAVLSLFFPLSRYVFIFVLRRRPAIDYEEYLRKQHAEFIKRQQEFQRQYQQQYGNPYGSYGTPNRPPYGQPQNEGRDASPADDEPFAEFGGKSQNDGQSSANEKKDDEWFV